MATEFGFELAGPATAGEVADVYARTGTALGLVEDDEVRFTRPGAELRSGVLVVVTAATPLPFPDPVEKVFGFAPAVNTLFRFDKVADPIEQKKDMLRLVVAVLGVFPGDALLEFAGEISRLVRRHGRFVISDDSDFWIPELVSLLPPHDQAQLPNL